MVKRILVLFLCITMLIFVPVSVSASHGINNIYIYYGDEESMGTSRGDWNFSTKTSGSYLEKSQIDGETAFHFYAGGASDKISAVLYFNQIKRNDPDKFVIQFKMRIDNIASFVNSTADAGPNPNWHFFSYFSLDQNGGMYVDGKNITTLQDGKFYEMAFLTDNRAKSCKVYVNNVFTGSFSFDKNYNWLAEYAFSLQGNSGGSHLYLADFAMYEADSVKTYAQLEEAFAEKKASPSDCPMVDELREFAGNYTLFAAEAPYVYADGERKNTKVPFIKDVKTLMAPLIDTAEILGLSYKQSGSVVSISSNGRTVTFSADNLDSFGGKVIEKNGILYAEADKFISLFRTVYIGKEYPFIAVGNDNLGNHFTKRIDEREMYFYLMYEKPVAGDILKDFKETSENVHPRVYYTNESIEKIKSLAETDSDMKYWYDTQLSNAQKAYGLPVINLIITDNELNTSYSGDVGSFSKLAFAYMVTKDKKWGDDLWRAINGFIDANEDLNHRRAFLNGSEGARQIALAYDWAYDYFTDEQRNKMENYLYVTTFEPWMRAHQGLTGYGSSGYAYKSESNINCVLSAQIGVAAMAVFEKKPEFYAKLMSAIYRQIEYFLPGYSPDGGFYEGPSYWEYATTNLVNLFEVTESTFGTLYGLYDVFNVKNTGEFPIYMNGDKLQFNFGDGYRLSLAGSFAVSYYFAVKNGDRAFAKTIIDLMREANYPIGNRWYDPAFPAQEAKGFSLDRYFRDVEAGSMRENWTTNGVYLAYHGGENNIGHGDLDIGTFVLDAYGKRWAEELGSDDYNYDQYFGTKRYLYYKKRGEGQNVLLINPYGKYEDQKKNAFSTILTSASGENGAYAVLDTSEAYGSDVTSAKRGYMLTDERKQVVIRDEVALTGNDNELYWFMHTMAEKCEIENGGKRAILSIGRHKCIMELTSSENAVFEIMDPLHIAESTKPQSQYYTNLVGIYKKVAVHIKGAKGNVYINVNMRVIDVTEDREVPVILDKPISEWDTVYDNVYENKPYEESVFFTEDKSVTLYPVNNSTVVTTKTYVALNGAYVKSADIYIDGSLVERFDKPPFGKSISLPDGAHTIKAVYTDIYGEKHTVYSTVNVKAKYNIIKERIFDFEDFDGTYEAEAETYKVFKDSLFLAGYGTASKHAYMDIKPTDAGYGKSLFSETITGDMLGFGLTDWGDTWYDALYVEYDLLGSEFGNRVSEVFSVQCHGTRLSTYTIKNGMLKRGDKELFFFENSKWYHIAMLFDSVDRTVSIYINGECIVENDYVAEQYGSMRPGNIVLGSYIPNSVMLVDNYKAINMAKMPDISVCSESGKEGYVKTGDKKLFLTSSNFVELSSLNTNTITITENGKAKPFSIEFGEITTKKGTKYVKEATIVFDEAVKSHSEYVVTLKKGINTCVENINSKYNITFAFDKIFRFYADGKSGLGEIRTSVENGLIKYSFNAVNETNYVGKVVICIAVYSDEGLCDIKFVKQSIPIGTNTVSATYALSDEGKTYKVFYADSMLKNMGYLK